MEREAEPWLRGTHGDLPPMVRAVVHALELAREDGQRWCGELSDEQMHARPAEIASVAFQLRHVVRSLDRLLTYAEGRSLSAEQLAALKTEMDAVGTRETVLAEFRAGIDAAIERVRGFAGTSPEEARGVGRKALPTTVGGLLVHCAEHTQRHVGQLVTTAKVALRRTRAM